MLVDKYPSIFLRQNGDYSLHVYNAVLYHNFAYLQHNEFHCVCDYLFVHFNLRWPNTVFMRTFADAI